MSKIIEQITAERQRQGVSRYRLAKNAKVQLTHFSKIEAGMISPSLTIAEKMADVLNCELRLVPKEKG